MKDIAANYKITQYVRVNTINEVKDSLMQYGPVLITFPVYDQNSQQFWRKPSSNAKLIGHHAVVIVGWDEKDFTIRK